MNRSVMLVSSWDGKIPSEQVFNLSKSLEKADDNTLSALAMLSLKNPIIGLMLGLFLGPFGVDRFYKGDIGLGVAKLIFTLTIIGAIVSIVWAIVDLFLVYMGIKNDNFQKITQVLSMANSK